MRFCGVTKRKFTQYRSAGIVAFLVAFCSAQKVALPEPGSSSTPAVRDLQVSDIFIPSELGYVVETDAPGPAGAWPHPPVLIHIQEAHSDYEGQRHLVGILRRLVEDHGLRLILVEGGEGSASLAFLRDYSMADDRKQVAEKYLKLGLLSGEEYLDMVSEYPLELWGVERGALYDQHVQLFLDSEPLRESVRPLLAKVRVALEALRPLVSDPALVALDADAAAFERGERSLSLYAESLAGLAAQHGIPESDVPEMTRFLALRRLERTLDQRQLQEEQTALLEQLHARLEPEAWKRLEEAAGRLRTTPETARDFYAGLERIIADSSLSLEPFPALSTYVSCLRDSAQLDSRKLSEELSRLTARLREALTTTSESRRLASMAGELDLVEKLLDFKLSPDEYRTLSALDLSGLAGRWSGTVDSLLKTHGLEAQQIPALEPVEAALPTLLRFYRLAEDRDEAIAERALAKLRESGQPLAVLITGGFHSPGIAERLKASGVGLVVVTPKLSVGSDEALYRAVLKYKTGHGSFTEVQAAAAQAVPQQVSR